MIVSKSQFLLKAVAAHKRFLSPFDELKMAGREKKLQIAPLEVEAQEDATHDRYSMPLVERST